MDTKDIAQRYLDRAHNKQATRLYRVHVSASTTIRCSQRGQEARELKGPPLLLGQGQSMVTTAYAYLAVPSSGESEKAHEETIRFSQPRVSIYSCLFIWPTHVPRCRHASSLLFLPRNPCLIDLSLYIRNREKEILIASSLLLQQKNRDPASLSPVYSTLLAAHHRIDSVVDCRVLGCTWWMRVYQGGIGRI